MSQPSEEKKHLAILTLNLKGAKKKRMYLIDIAYSCDYLTKLYGSMTKVAEKVGVHPETIREFCSLLKLPETLRPFIQEIGLDAAYRISKLKEKDALEVAELSLKAYLSSHEIREVVKLKLKNQELSVPECINIVLGSRPIVKKQHLVLVKLEEPLLELLKDSSKEMGLSEKYLLKNAISDGSQVAISSLNVKGDDVILIMEDSEFVKLQEQAQNLHLSLEALVNRFIGKSLRGRTV